MPHLNIDDVVVVTGRPRMLTSAAEVDALESRLWIRLPSGYREYMELLGTGYLGIILIYTPRQIEKNLVEWRRRIDKYWFWDETLDLLPKERALECVVVGDTSNDDELIFHPCRPDRLFVLPSGRERAFEVGGSLLEAIEWLCSSGQVIDSFPERDFEPPEPHDGIRVGSTGGVRDLFIVRLQQSLSFWLELLLRRRNMPSQKISTTKPRSTDIGDFATSNLL